MFQPLLFESHLFTLMVWLSNRFDCLHCASIHAKLNGWQIFGIVIKDEKANGMTIKVTTMSTVTTTKAHTHTEEWRERIRVVISVRLCVLFDKIKPFTTNSAEKCPFQKRFYAYLFHVTFHFQQFWHRILCYVVLFCKLQNARLDLAWSHFGRFHICCCLLKCDSLYSVFLGNK